MLNAALWMQQAQESRAQVLQTYRQATLALSAAVRSKRPAALEQWHDRDARSKPPAVVLDVDETVLDNLPFSAGLVKAGRAYDAQAERDWERWVLAAEARAVPGAPAFIERARSAGLRVVFVTNRACPGNGRFDASGRAVDCPQKEATRANLARALGLAVSPDDLMLRHDRQGRDDRSKVARRAEVARTHRIVMLLGDDLQDFVQRGDYRPEDHDALWGSRWFLIANPLYGSWEQGQEAVAQKLDALQAWSASSTPAAVPTDARAHRPDPRAGTAGTGSTRGAASLRVASWNLEWLVDPQQLQQADYWRQCRGAAAAGRGPGGERTDRDRHRDRDLSLPPCDAYRRAGVSDDHGYRQRKLAAVREGLQRLADRGLDVLAVQEVHSESALQPLLPVGYRVACMTRGPRLQQVGFVLRSSLMRDVRCEPVGSLALDQDRLRPGLALRLARPGAPGGDRVLLNLHLKAGCPGGPLDPGRTECAQLQRQTLALEDWIEARAREGVPFLLLGDFNRDLPAERRHPARHDGGDPRQPVGDHGQVRNLWPEIDDGEPAASAMVVATHRRDPAVDGRCRTRVDHLALSRSWLSLLQQDSLDVGGAPAARFLPITRAASDHCPLWADLVER